LLVSEDCLESITFGFFVLFTLSKGIDVLLENGFLGFPVSIKFREILLGIFKEILKEISSLIDGSGCLFFILADREGAKQAEQGKN
jgi:hypothetical protein